MLNFFQILYTNLGTILLKENLILLVVLILAVYSQTLDNYEKIQSMVKKLNFLLFQSIIILITGLGINTGSSDKFIYFDF